MSETSVRLTDRELLALDGHVRDDIQAEVEAAKERLTAVNNHPGLPEHLARFVADAVREARDSGLLVYWYKRLRRCSLCGRNAGYWTLKSGPRKGQKDHSRPLTFGGFELARRFVSFEGHARLGGCQECVEASLPALREALRGVPAQVPGALRAEGEPKRTKHDNRVCTECGWEGHEGEMGRRATLMGDGSYPASCPSCGATNRPLSSLVVKPRDGFQVVPS